MRRRVALVVCAVLAFVVAVGAVALARRGRDCPVWTPEGDALPQLVAAADLAPPGSVGEQRRPVLEAVGALGAPFGELLAGRFYDSAARMPTLKPSGGGVVLMAARRTSGSFEALALPDGDPLWAREYVGDVA